AIFWRLVRRSRRLRALLRFVEVLGARKESAKNRRILKCICMRYLVRARVKPGREKDLLNAIRSKTLGRGSVAEGEYLRNMKDARLCGDDTARWVEVCRSEERRVGKEWSGEGGASS